MYSTFYFWVFQETFRPLTDFLPNRESYCLVTVAFFMRKVVLFPKRCAINPRPSHWMWLPLLHSKTLVDRRIKKHSAGMVFSSAAAWCTRWDQEKDSGRFVLICYWFSRSILQPFRRLLMSTIFTRLRCVLQQSSKFLFLRGWCLN